MDLPCQKTEVEYAISQLKYNEIVLRMKRMLKIKIFDNKTNVYYLTQNNRFLSLKDSGRVMN